MTDYSKILNFILIDDSRIDLFIIEKLISTCYPGAKIRSFALPDIALQHFKENLPESKTIVFLDINMPIMDGFQFLEEFDKLPPDHKNNYRIYILTSSQNANDSSRGKSNKYVSDVIIKPMSKDTLLSLQK